jgi:hypothetical protein
MTKTKFNKDGKKWIEQERITETIDQDTYYNLIEARETFRRWGFYEKHNKSYTPMGRVVTEINSIDPDRQIKILRNFNITMV